MNKLIQIPFRNFAAGILLMLLLSCGKTFSTNLDFDAIETPKSIAVGLPVKSKVRLRFYTTTFKIDFLGFQTKEISMHHYSIVAPAEYRSHGEGRVNAMYWFMDTTYVINTGSPGQYILDFFDSKGQFKSDTVIVQ